MSMACLRSLRAPSFDGGMRSALGLARWLLILLLVFDQVGSPLHNHHHDSGIDAHALELAHADASANASHRDLTDSGAFLYHSVTAVKNEVHLAAMPAGDSAALLAFPSALTLFALQKVVDHPARSELTPGSLIYRSLPPDTRAPPLHA